MNIKCYKSLFFVVMLNFTSSARVEAQVHHQEAHVHGKAELTIAAEELRIEMHFVSPATNILGFEHKPANKQQQAIAEQARLTLAEANNLFEFKKADCKVEDADIHFPALDIQKETGDHKNHNHDHEKSSHSEVDASYVFVCAKQLPSAIFVRLQDSFPGIENLYIQWITENGQGAQELKGTARQINLH